MSMGAKSTRDGLVLVNYMCHLARSQYSDIWSNACLDVTMKTFFR